MWIKVDDHFDQHPKLQCVGPIGLALWVSGLAYCSRNLTDGFIPWAAARTLLALKFCDPRETERGRKIWDVGLGCGMSGMDGSEALEETIELLLAATLWEECSLGYIVHDYLDHQLSKEQVLQARQMNTQRQAKHRDSKRNAVSNAVSNGSVTPAKTVDVDVDVDVDSGIGLQRKDVEDLTPLTGGNTPAEELQLTVQETRKQVARAKAITARTKQLTAEFERIWNLYPHHGRRSLRALSLKRWLALQPRPEIEAVLASINAAMASPDWRKDGGEYVPGLQVWINSHGWDASHGSNGNGNGNGKLRTVEEWVTLLKAGEGK